jgi:hypothetical protein
MFNKLFLTNARIQTSVLLRMASLLRMSHASEKWWEYWKDYWLKRGTKDAYKEDYAFEVTIPYK